jgi:isoleucyl-tRNA synthetase
LIALREPVSKSLETARQEKVIGSSLEARVQLSANGDLYPLLSQYQKELAGLFIVSQVDLRNGAAGVAQAGDMQVIVERARGAKCERCWKYTEDVGSVAELPNVCAACAATVQEIQE